jgi:8-oxo-dGTP diphosphatase/2-hydroxy-dATP diphosphatase
MESKSRKQYTLVFVLESSRILLGLKKRGFGSGKWNGFGGKVEPNETIEQAAKRELLEESHLTANGLDKIGVITFEFMGNPVLMEVHVFTVNAFEGQPLESEEMRPQWFDRDSIPFSNMWRDDHIWFPLMFEGRRFSGYFVFKGEEEIVDYILRDVDSSQGIIIPLESVTC